MLFIVIIPLLWALNAIHSYTVGGTFMDIAVNISVPGIMVGGVGFYVLSYLHHRRHPDRSEPFKFPEHLKQLQLVGFSAVGFMVLIVVGAILFASNPWKFNLEVIYGLGCAAFVGMAGLLILFDVVLCIGVIQERNG
jgi:hypothetical protein